MAGAEGTTTDLLATVNNAGMDLLTYTYDSLNQLVRVDSQKANKSTTYSYDIRGNLLERKEYAYTTGTLGTATKTVSYAYGDSTWKDLMTSYSGQTITYDTIGNPLQYRDGMNFTWKNGRQLATYSKGPVSASYEYDINGQRTKKTFNRVADSVTTQYYYSNGMLLGFYRSDGFDVKTLLDISGSVYGITVSNGSANSMVYFAYNAQGDVIGLYGYNGTLYATYDYDAWGNCTVTPLVADTAGHSITDANHIAHINPFRYRGYYYDTETGFYASGTRCYDPAVGRFINADTTDILQVQEDLYDKNLFAYCDNNPVMRADHGGDFWHIAIGAVVGGLIGGAVKAVSNVIEGKDITDGLGTAMLAGAASGALASTGVGLVGMMAGNAAISMAENATNQVIANKGFNNFDVGDMVTDGVIGGVSGAIGGAGRGSKHLTNLGKQTVKRTINATANKGIKAGMKEAGKAFAYYGKNTGKYYRSFLKGLPGDFFSTVGTTIASSNYMKYQYRRLTGR